MDLPTNHGTLYKDFLYDFKHQVSSFFQPNKNAFQPFDISLPQEFSPLRAEIIVSLISDSVRPGDTVGQLFPGFCMNEKILSKFLPCRQMLQKGHEKALISGTFYIQAAHVSTRLIPSILARRSSASSMSSSPTRHPKYPVKTRRVRLDTPAATINGATGDTWPGKKGHVSKAQRPSKTQDV